MLAFALLLGTLTARAAEPPVLLRAYSHNDYEQARPLVDALDRGFFGVEADVHLRGDEFFVAHTGGGVKPGVTLRKLYLDPLLARVRANGGSVYPGGPKGFLLMIEFKSDADDSWKLIKTMLEPYKEMLTSFTPDAIHENAVTVVITGHRPNDLLAREPARFAGIDGDFRDFDKPDKTLFPVISDSWMRYLADEDTPDSMFVLTYRLRRYVERAHARGRKIRLYDLPNKERYWRLVYDAGVDYINADKLEELRAFLLRQANDVRRVPAEPL